MTQIREAGVLKYIENSYLGSIIEHLNEDSFASIEIDLVTLPFTIMLVGVGLSLLVLIYEIAAFQSARQNDGKPTKSSKYSALWNQSSLWQRNHKWRTKKRRFLDTS